MTRGCHFLLLSRHHRQAVGVGGGLQGAVRSHGGAKRKHDTEPRHVHVAIGKCSGQRSSRIVSDGRSVVPLSTSVLHCDDTVIVERVCS